MKNKLASHEKILKGMWFFHSGKIDVNEEERRIDYLVKNVLKEIAVSSDGWKKLYVDPSDERYWELIYPHSDWHGGGPRQLSCILKDEASKKFNVAL